MTNREYLKTDKGLKEFLVNALPNGLFKVVECVCQEGVCPYMGTKDDKGVCRLKECVSNEEIVDIWLDLERNTK